MKSIALSLVFITIAACQIAAAHGPGTHEAENLRALESSDDPCVNVFKGNFLASGTTGHCEKIEQDSALDEVNPKYLAVIASEDGQGSITAECKQQPHHT
jgi:hypothetical protein